MDIQVIYKKAFWPIFIVVFVVITYFVATGIYNSIYESRVQEAIGTGQDVEQTAALPESESEEASEEDVLPAVYACEMDTTVTARAYVYLHGFGDHNPDSSVYRRDLIDQDSKTQGVLDFDYDETLTLDEISLDFISQFNAFAGEHDVDEIIIIGQSAGGVIAAYSAHALEFDGEIELHTLASPLNGYHVSDAFLQGMSGFGRELGEGFESFAPAPSVRTYHHKTVEDDDLRNWCGDYAQFCDPLDVQNNNIPGSQEFFYPEHDHVSIMPAVSTLIVECHS